MRKIREVLRLHYECGCQHRAQRWILARLRNRVFFSLAALNNAIAELSPSGALKSQNPIGLSYGRGRQRFRILRREIKMAKGKQTTINPSTVDVNEARSAFEASCSAITLKQLALATWHARQQLSAGAASATVPAPVLVEAQDVRGRMLRVLEYYFEAHLLVGPQLSVVRAGSGYQDLENERKFWPTSTKAPS